MGALSPLQAWRIAALANDSSSLYIADAVVESSVRKVCDAHGNSCTRLYIQAKINKLSTMRVDAHITLLKTYGRSPSQTGLATLSAMNTDLARVFESGPVDAPTENWTLLFTPEPEDLPKRAILHLYGSLRDRLYAFRNTVAQRMRYPLTEMRRDFHLSVDRVYVSLPREQRLRDDEGCE